MTLYKYFYNILEECILNERLQALNSHKFCGRRFISFLISIVKEHKHRITSDFGKINGSLKS